MFSIGDRSWPGISKLVEECGEVLQVCGKLMGTRGSTTYWGDFGDLKVKLEEEIADLIAASEFVIRHGGLDSSLIHARVRGKLDKFEQWHRTDPEGPKTSHGNPDLL